LGETKIMDRAASLAIAVATTLFITAALTPASAEAAKEVYRCTVNGKVLYADEPCSSQAREVMVNDSRSTEQRQDAEAAARREATMARQMRRDRIEDERIAARDKRGAAGIKPAPRSSGGVEYSNTSGKVTKNVRARKESPKFDDAMPIYIDVPKPKN
jgi:hypothetical protein